MKLYEFFNVPVDKTGKESKPFKKQHQEDKQKAADDAFWYILDHDQLHKEFVLPYVKEIKTLVSDPNFNKDRFTKSWIPMINKGCSLYHKKSKMTGDPKDLFDKQTREDLALRFAEQLIDDISNDEFHVGNHSR